MNNIQIFLDFTFQSFWHFIGIFMLITIPFNFLSKMTKILMESNNVKRHGWNPNEKPSKDTIKEKLNDFDL